MYLIFDTETTGLPKDYKAPISNTDNWPRMVQLSWQVHDKWGNFIKNEDLIIKPEGYTIPFNASKIHGITNEIAKERGVKLEDALEKFNSDLEGIEIIAGHNIEFDINVLGCEFFRKNINTNITEIKSLDTCDEGTASLCRIAGGRGGKYKFPKLEELYNYLFSEILENAHNSAVDVEATTRCFLELIRIGHFKNEIINEKYLLEFKDKNPNSFKPAGIDIQKYDIKKETNNLESDKNTNLERLKNINYSHIHNHTPYSILSATTKIDSLINKAVEYKMPAVGMTDFGNLYGAFDFRLKIDRKNKDNEEKLLGIVGCELFVSEDHKCKKFTKNNPDRRFNQVLLAKNKEGFNNLSKLSSYGFIDGFYAGIPRISKELILEYKENLIALTGGLDGEIPNLILNRGKEVAEKSFIWWKENFGEDFYIELLNHGEEAENHVNEVLLTFSKKYDVKYIAQNNTFYENKKDSEAHDILLCVKNGEKKETPIGRGRGFRFGFPNDQYYFKSQEKMKELFHNTPKAIENISELLEKFENYTLERDVLLPKFDIPKEFKTENEYLKYLTYEGAKNRWGDNWENNKERLDFELEIISKTGYPGYFLIVQDIIKNAKNIGVLVGPGRGSAAGSAVAYCTDITSIDPIKYDLLFERFLNPERISMPDIDIDFDDEGRDKIIEWTIEKYGSKNVAQIITYGTMASKSSVRDTSRVLDYPLPETNLLANLLPDIKLNKMFKLDDKGLKDKAKNKYDDAKKFIEISKGNDERADIINKAKIIEGSVRNTGTHACGIIITPENITNLVPVSTAKDSDMLVSQYDNSYVESAGLLKMDFLGLKNLSIIRDTCELVKKNYNIEIDIDNIDIDNKTEESKKTYELFQKGKTVATFQYESDGMRKYLRDLKPTKFSDLIAMNALYRPGPLEYIPSFVRRKHGEEKIIYDLDATQEYLEETYGITVYQEQVMLLSQKLANFTKGEADTLRKAMGKKQRDILDKMKPKFIDNGKSNGHSQEKLEKIWKDWEAFAEYAFNKSHSTCYAFIGYQTGYLKANYPSEYMSSVLSKNMKNIDSIGFFMEECKRMGLNVLPPSVNESIDTFSVNKNGDIRFGMNAIKGVGGISIENVIQEREKNGKYKSIFDFIKRIDSMSCNKRTLEGLAQAGAFDEFKEMGRHQYFSENEKGQNFIEELIKYGNKLKKEECSSQVSMFGDDMQGGGVIEPKIPICEEWGAITKLKKEQEVLGIFVSGHPLDDYKNNFKYFIKTDINDLKENPNNFISKIAVIGGMIISCEHRTSQKGDRWGMFTIEDFTGSYTIRVFKQNYEKIKHLIDNEIIVCIELKLTKNQYKDNEYWQNIINMELMSSITKLDGGKIKIKLNTEDVNQNLFNYLDKIKDIPQGNTELILEMIDTEKNILLDMFSKKRIDATIENLNIIYDSNYPISIL